MSFGLTLKIQKANEKEGIVVLEMYTTPARELFDNVDLVSCSEDYVFLTKDKLDEIISFYSDEAERFKSYASREENNLSRLERMVKEASSAEVFNEILEKMSDAESEINFWEEEAETAELWRNQWQFAKNLLELQFDYGTSTNPYELVYIAG